MPPSPRPSGSFPHAARAAGSMPSVPAYDLVKTRVLIKLEDRLDSAKSRRMPLSLLQQTTRQQVEQTIDAEGPRLARADRDRMVEEVYGETFGFGPLEELFRDPTANEIVVLGPQAVIVRREQGWLPTNVKFRDEEQLRQILDRVGMQGEAVGGALPASVRDAKLANGFRVVAVIPPAILAQPATAVFTRAEPGTPTPPPVATPLPIPPGSRFTVATPPPLLTSDGTAAIEHQLARHRARITERIITKLASLGVYDLSRVDTTELRRIVAAYVSEYGRTENIYLSDTDQGRLILAILTGMNR